MASPAALFSSILPAECVVTSPEDLRFYGKDSSSQFKAAPSVILLPSNAAQILSIVKLCNDRRLSLVPSGGRTGYSGGATAENGEAVLSLKNLNRIISVNAVDQSLACQAGATTEAVRQAAANQGLFYPVDFASKGSSHIGGNLATNAGGIRVIRYGSTRDWVLGMKVITGAGEELSLNGALVKNATGFDLRHLFIGSEGTLGIITEATLRLTTQPKDSSLALCALNSVADCLTVLREIRSRGLTINVIEYFERNALELVTAHTGLPAPFAAKAAAYVVLEVETPETTTKNLFQAAVMSLIEDGLVADAVVAESEKHRLNLMALRERISETIGRTNIPHKNDIAVPVASIADFVECYRSMMQAKFSDFEVIVFGHVGDGNLHLNVLKPKPMDEGEFFKRCELIDEETFKIVRDFAGSVSAEHGVGLLKKKYLGYSRSAAEIQLMQKIKADFDPNGILNPGKIFN